MKKLHIFFVFCIITIFIISCSKLSDNKEITSEDISISEQTVTRKIDKPLKIISAEASSEEYVKEQKQFLKAEYIFDGDFNTRWSSEFKDNQWVMLTLNKIALIKNINIRWETAYPKEFNVQFSTDKDNWVTVYRNTDFDGGISNINIPPTKALFIKINCVKRSTGWGNSIYEVKVKE